MSQITKKGEVGPTRTPPEVVIEMRVLRQKRHSVEYIAKEMGVSVHTVKRYTQDIEIPQSPKLRNDEITDLMLGWR